MLNNRRYSGALKQLKDASNVKDEDDALLALVTGIIWHNYASESTFVSTEASIEAGRLDSRLSLLVSRIRRNSLTSIMSSGLCWWKVDGKWMTSGWRVDDEWMESGWRVDGK
jgi:hypothetical protein